MDQFPKLRPVGRLERCSTARHHLGFYYNVAVAACYTLPKTFTLPIKDYVYKACETLIGQHPILTAVPIDEGTKEPYFARLPNVDLSQSVFFEKRKHNVPDVDDRDEELDTLLNTQHNIAFKLPLPSWRLIVLTDDADRTEREFTVVFVFHHAISDGTSGKVFHKSFLQALQSMSSLTTDAVKEVIQSPDSPLLPPGEAVHPQPLSMSYLAIQLFKDKIYKPRDPGLWTGSEIRTPLETKVNHIVFPKHISSAFKERCRENKTTITAALQTIFARSLFTHLPETFTKVQCNSPMSARRFLPDPITDDSMGVWVQEYTEQYARKDLSDRSSFPWSEAVRSRATIEKEISKEGGDSSVNLLKYVDDYHNKLYLSKIGQQRSSTFEVSNLGAIDLGPPVEGMPRIGRVIFSQSASVTGNAIEVSVASGGDGCLVLAFVWQEGVVEELFMLSVIGSVRKEIYDLCGTDLID
ncbi:alcohol acetyltransferase [Aspergillus coremiiformis]|uniref:Alcohol acetyltransferase n=1 Tax=Aspergillus coremiiformis TaxID=138285 RepID=A0A5N6Z330_9EURO|nr:alcohol acetyltransferase [Aspergillus coremiiformis]